MDLLGLTLADSQLSLATGEVFSKTKPQGLVQPDLSTVRPEALATEKRILQTQIMEITQTGDLVSTVAVGYSKKELQL